MTAKNRPVSAVTSIAIGTTEVGVAGLADPTTSKSWFHRELRTLQALAAHKKAPTVRIPAQRSHHSRDQLPALSNELFVYHERCGIACQGQIPRGFRLPEEWMATSSSDGRMDRRVAGGDTQVRARSVSRVRVSRRGGAPRTKAGAVRAAAPEKSPRYTLAKDPLASVSDSAISGKMAGSSMVGGTLYS